jgi:type IX secretion system PorP/SprF family membrane protein
MRKKSYILFILLLIASTGFAQQEAMFTHYMYNTLAINPAYAGSRDALTVTALYRSQWVSFPGAPVTQTITVHSPCYKDGVNLGLSVLNDKIGPVNNTSFFLDYAYRVKLNKKSKLAFGLKFGLNTYSIDLKNLQSTDNTDELTQTADNSILPNVGFGIYYSRPRFYAGLSTPKLFQNGYSYDNISTKLSTEQRHYYLISGGLIRLHPDWDLKPTCFVKITKAATIEADVTAEVLYLERFSLGIMGRSGDAIGFLAGVGITDQLTIGYSFDWSFVNNTAKYNYGSHELILRYDFMSLSGRRIRSPRYFSTF